MSEQKHTPGPWQVSRGYNTTDYPCFYIHGMAGDQKRDVATLDANARLIAAAPELLEALKRIGDPEFRYASDDDEDTQLSMRIADARAAIAKATGR